MVKFVRRMLWRILGRPPATARIHVGKHGCLRCAASFLAWNQVDGDYLEFGVFRGGSFAEAYRAINMERQYVFQQIGSTTDPEFFSHKPRFFAFDSFRGIPGGEAERHADYDEGAYSCSESEFLENIQRNGVDLDHVITVPGFYDDSLTPEIKEKLGLERAALIMIDCDLYESTVPVLDFVTDLVTQGTIIIFDDWYRFKGSPDSGEQRACSEWLARNPQISLVKYWQQGPQSVAFLVNKN